MGIRVVGVRGRVKIIYSIEKVFVVIEFLRILRELFIFICFIIMRKFYFYLICGLLIEKENKFLKFSFF